MNVLLPSALPTVLKWPFRGVNRCIVFAVLSIVLLSSSTPGQPILMQIGEGVNNIPGEVDMVGYEGWHEVLSFYHRYFLSDLGGLSPPVGGLGQSVYEITKYVNEGSPKLQEM